MAEDYPGSAPVSHSVPHITITKSHKSDTDYPGAEPVSSSGRSETKSAYGEAADIAPGFYERGIGVDQLLNNIGVGKYFPVFRDGKLSIGLPPNEELAAQEKLLEEKNKGVKNTIREIATDPMTYLPIGKLGLVAGGAVQGGASALTGPTSKGDQTLGERVEGAGQGAGLGGATGGILGALGKASPKNLRPATGEFEKDTDSLYKKAQQIGLRLTGKEKPKEIYDKIQEATKGKIGEIADTISPGAAAKESIWPVGVNLATSQMYEATKQAGGVLYNQAKEIGRSQTLPAEEVISHLDGFISDMEKSAPLHAGIDPNFNTKLNKIRQIRDGIAKEEPQTKTPWEQILHAMNHLDDNPKKMLNGAQLIELDQAVNSFYGAKGADAKENISVNKIKGTFNKAIEDLSPDFKAAYAKAKNYWRQNVIQNFDENPVLSKYWKPEDAAAFKAVAQGIELHPALKKRVEGMLDKIDSPLALDELKKALPPQMYDRLRGAKFIQMMDEAGLNAKVLNDDKTYAMLVRTLENKPEQMQALEAMKTFVEQMNKRGIGKDLNPAELEESSKYLDRAMRTMFSFATGHRLYGIKHAMEAIAGESPNAVQGRLTGFAKDVAKSKPAPVYKPGVISKTAIRPLAVEEGKATQ